MKPSSQTFERILEYRVQIENRGFPRDRTVDGFERWRHIGDISLVFMMYGTNGAMNFGGHWSGILSLNDYPPKPHREARHSTVVNNLFSKVQAPTSIQRQFALRCDKSSVTFVFGSN
jgi:hypothetical protein